MKTSARRRGSIWFVCQPILLNAFSVPVTAFIFYRLGQFHLGEWATAASLIAATSFVSNLGLRTIFVRDLAQQTEHEESLVAAQLGLRLLLSVAAGTIALCVCALVHYSPVITACVLVNFIGMVLSTIASVFMDVMQARQRFTDISRVNLAAGVLLTLASLLAVMRSTSPILLSFSYLLGPVISVAVFGALVSRSITIRPDWDRNRHRKLLHQIRSLAANLTLATLQERIEQLVVPRLVGVAEFGLFTGGSMPADRLGIVPDGLATVYYPIIARTHSNEPKNTTKPVEQLFTISLISAITVSTLITFLARPISILIFRHNANLYQPIIQLTIWALPLQSVALSVVYALQAAGQHAEAARRNAVSSITSIVISLLLIGKLHLVGACVSLLLKPLITASAVLPMFTRTFPGCWSRLPLTRIAISFGAMVLVLLLTDRLVHHGIWIDATVGAVAATGVLVLALVCTRLVTRELLSEL